MVIIMSLDEKICPHCQCKLMIRGTIQTKGAFVKQCGDCGYNRLLTTEEESIFFSYLKEMGKNGRSKDV